jgi:hypothetical protein
MILWSKGLGRLVLNVRLSERSGMTDRDERIVIDGTMGPPTFWDYSVTLSENDVVDFIGLLKQPAPLRFLTATPKRGSILAAALVGLAVCLRRTAYRFLGGKAGAAPAAGEHTAIKPGSGSEHGGS